MDSIELEITTPEKLSFKGMVSELILPGAAGSLGIRPGHAPLLCAMRAGILTAITDDGKSSRFVLGGGFFEVSGDHVRILADTSDKEDEIDLERAKAAFQDADEKLRHLTFGTSEHLHQWRRRARAQLRIELAEQNTAKTSS